MRSHLGEITVWAPIARTVDIVLGTGEEARAEPMTRGDEDWWTWQGPVGPDGEVDYAFVVDGAPPALPDPRSAWQPFDVHGPSRRIDPARFDWTDAGWPGPRGGQGTLGGVVYELHVGTFTPEGTLGAAIGRLDHLVDVGVDVVQILPVAAFPGRWGWGYDGVALYAVHDTYGGPAALARFVDACHARGLGVCLDVVYNHLGPSGNYLARFGPYFTDEHATPWGSAVNLDQPGSAGARRFIIENATRWFRDFHIDALRLDAVHELKDDSPRHLLAELSDEVAALAATLGRPLDLIAESDLNDVRMVGATHEGGLGMSAQWDDDVHHALHVLLTGETQGYYADFAGDPATDEPDALAVLAKVFTRGFLHDGNFSSFRGQNWGAPIDVETFDARKLLGYLQTHDQVGNRAIGDRITALLSPGRQALGAALYLLGPFTPMIFAGEEWGSEAPWLFFTSHEDHDLAESIRTGRRSEFAGHGWDAEDIPDPQDDATRDASVLRWNERAEPGHRRLLDWYRTLIGLRRSEIAGPTSLADVAIDSADDGTWLRMRHRGLVVVGALAGADASLDQPGAHVVAAFGAARLDGGRLSLDGDAVAVLRAD